MADLIDARTDHPDRLPPGQIVTRKWSVLHSGTVPTVDLARWRFTLKGLVERPLALTWEELQTIPRRETACDMHCVTRERGSR
jgi:DMSO/TMAO reductase YedYZ molybdopterin-dependent catalytic subunit